MSENEQTSPVEPVDLDQIAADAVRAEEEAKNVEAEAHALPAEEVKAQDLRPGMTIRVYQKISEGEKTRTQIFQGMILAMRGKTPATKTITVQKQSFGVWVEKIFPVASPLIEKIEVVKQAKVRRSKLFFMQEYGRRLKETLVKN